MTAPTPGASREARIAAAGAIFDLIGKGSLPLDRGQMADRLAAAALAAAAPLITAEADKRRMPGRELYEAGAEAERQRCTELAAGVDATYRTTDDADPSPFAENFAGLIRSSAAKPS